MKKRIVYSKQVESFLGALSASARSSVLTVFDLLSERGFLRAPYAEKVVGQNGLFEVRAKDFVGQYRVFYVYADGDLIFALSGFTKKTAKTPKSEIDKALKVRKELGL